MWHEQQLWEWAEAELAGTLDAAMTQALAEQKANDPLFAAAHEERLGILRGIAAQGRNQAFRQNLKQIHTQLQSKEKPAMQPAGRVLPFFKRYWKTAAVAAGVAVLSSSLTMLSLRHNAPSKAATTRSLQLLRRDIEHIRQHQNQQQQQIQDIKATVTLAPAVSDFSGTGFALTNDGYVATNYHLIADADSIYLQTADGRYAKARIIAFEPATDVAVLRVADKGFHFSKEEVPYTLSTGRTAIGARVFTLGYPQDEVVYSEGYVSARHGFGGDSAQYRLEIPASPGQSGSPVLDAQGNLVAIVSGKESQSAGTTYAVTSRTLLRLLKRLPKDYKLSLPGGNRLRGLSREQQIETLQDFTCIIRVYKKAQ